ncbi:MAG TPA: hypothetical protein VIS94_15825 [Desulfomonilia bacterium]
MKNKELTVTIETECACCKEPLVLEVDSSMNYRVLTENSAPVVFAPLVDFEKLDEPSIIDSF